MRVGEVNVSVRVCECLQIVELRVHAARAHMQAVGAMAGKLNVGVCHGKSGIASCK